MLAQTTVRLIKAIFGDRTRISRPVLAHGDCKAGGRSAHTSRASPEPPARAGPRRARDRTDTSAIGRRAANSARSRTCTCPSNMSR